MKLKTPKFKKNKIEQGRYYKKVEKEPVGILYINISDVNILNVSEIETLLEKINKTYLAFPNHEIRVLSSNLGRIL